MPNIRPMRLPQDVDLYLQITREVFQFPEHPEWNLQPDEFESIVETMSNIKRFWPLLSFAGKLSPEIRELLSGYRLYGFFYEEDGQAVGHITYRQLKGRQEWYISDVVVLPAFRRRGIARQLVVAALDEIRARNGQQAILDVIYENLPAYNLYKDLGFEVFSGSVDFLYEQKSLPAANLPAGYSLAPLPEADLLARVEFDQRITPELTRKFTPATEVKRPRPWLLASVSALRKLLTRRKIETFVVRRQATQQEAGLASYEARTRPGGVNLLKVKIDPADPALAPFLITYMLECLQKAGKGQRIDFEFPTWQPALIEAAEALGAKRRSELHRMGLIIQAGHSKAQRRAD
jgi:GNAT superfamily N-acetyltransferase